MGLKEKRAIAELEKKLPEWTEQVKKASQGSLTALEVNWESLMVDDYADIYPEWEKVFMQPITKVLASICADKMGQDALKAKYKKIKFQNVKGASSGDSSIEFSGDTIVLDHALANVDYWEESVTSWTKLIEDSL